MQITRENCKVVPRSDGLYNISISEDDGRTNLHSNFHYDVNMAFKMRKLLIGKSIDPNTVDISVEDKYYKIRVDFKLGDNTHIPFHSAKLPIYIATDMYDWLIS